MSQVLAGITVVELGSGALTGLPTMVLADFGATVVSFSHNKSDDESGVWQRGKTCVELNLDTDCEQLVQTVLENADVFITDLSEERLAEFAAQCRRLA
jgi:crotonobetainyl-CoA:carnitine CoA-transferase CaiB-like acyl-CoA transferase